MSKERSCGGEQLQAGDEVRLDAEVRIRLVLDQPADAAQDPVLAELVDLRRDRRTLFERQRRDHALQRRLALRKLLDPLRLGEMLRIVDVDLGEDERVDLHRRRGVEEIGGERLPLQ